MATLNISEYNRLARGNDGSPPMPSGLEPVLARQDVAIGATSTQSVTLHRHTMLVRVVSDLDCRIEFGTDPTAGAMSAILPAGSVEYFGVEPGSDYKIAVVQL